MIDHKSEKRARSWYISRLAEIISGMDTLCLMRLIKEAEKIKENGEKGE